MNITTFMSTAVYTCNTGYNLTGDMTRTCQANGTWSGIAPTCESIYTSFHLCILFYKPLFSAVVTCPALTNPTNGMVSVPNNNFESNATYTCVTGYTLNGDTTRTCGSVGVWSGSEPTCTRKFTFLILRAHAFLIHCSC